MKIIDCKQGSTEWLMARAGIFTASEFDNLITPLWKAREGTGVETYIFRKLAERCMGIPLQNTANSFALEQGVILESEALPWYSFAHDTEVNRVGFVTSDDGRCGCSPDGLIGEDGGIEIKCPQPDTHLKYLLTGGVPKDYLAQVHGSMFVTGRPWWQFLSYSRQFPPLLVRVQRDDRIMAAIGAALADALVDFDEKFARISALKDGAEAPKLAIHAADIAKMREATSDGELPGEKWLRERKAAKTK